MPAPGSGRWRGLTPNFPVNGPANGPANGPGRFPLSQADTSPAGAGSTVLFQNRASSREISSSALVD